ncbi:hypothetical protein MNBD_ACTINO01-2357 [hydrothermal vent metagenome]|uniref:TNase-like domain-containing protein n=1 Tax=hydrothermal vent metagenome TaxID=652676 RepID=A0A3B0SZP6_9ZZZZ
MSWWLRRSTWQKVVIGVGVLLLALNTAVALFAAVSAGDKDSVAAPSPPQTTSASTTMASTSTVAAQTTTTHATTTSTTTATTSTTLALPPGTDRVTLDSVTDGDTVRVAFADGTIERVRLVGINTPENGECLAGEATQALTALLGSREFTMTTDVSDRDRYDRLLRYLWLDDGTLVNESLVADGFALARDYPPDSEYVDRFAAAQQRAEAATLGLWASDACGPSVGSGLEIISIEFDAPGDDRENLNGEWVEITNTGATAESMTSWVLKDESASHRYTFPAGFVLDPGSTVTVHTGCGADTAMTLYWCNDKGAVWNNSGDTAFLLDPTGNIVAKRSY